MTMVKIHKDVKRDISRIRRSDPEAARVLVDSIRRLESSSRGGAELRQATWRAFTPVDGYAIIVAGVGSGRLRVLGVGRLPSMYDEERLREMAESVMAAQSGKPGMQRDVRVPTPAPRSRIVALQGAPEALTPATTTGRSR